MRVCRYDKGNSRKFMCPFMPGSSRTRGSDRRTQNGKRYHNELDKSEWGLIEARVYNYRGFIFACWEEETPAFEGYLGDLQFYFDDYCELPDGTYGEWEAFGGIFKWRVPCNWKFGAENFGGDYYHNPSHASVDQVVLSPAGTEPSHLRCGDQAARTLRKLCVMTKEGHNARGELFKDDYEYMPTYQEMAVVEDYFRDAFKKRQEKLGEKARWYGHGSEIFPNVSYSNGVQSMGSWHPCGVHETEIWRIFMAPEDAPDEVEGVLLHYVIRYQGPSGHLEQDDMENWGSDIEGARGTIARHSLIITTAWEWVTSGARLAGGMAHGGDIYATEDVSEQNQRLSCARWARMMDVPPGADRKPVLVDAAGMGNLRKWTRRRNAPFSTSSCCAIKWSSSITPRRSCSTAGNSMPGSTS